VENVGDGPGTSRFVVNYRGPTYAPDRKRIDLEAGQRREWETELDPYGTRSADHVDFAVTTATGEREFTVTVEENGS